MPIVPAACSIRCTLRGATRNGANPRAQRVPRDPPVCSFGSHDELRLSGFRFGFGGERGTRTASRSAARAAVGRTQRAETSLPRTRNVCKRDERSNRVVARNIPCARRSARAARCIRRSAAATQSVGRGGRRSAQRAGRLRGHRSTRDSVYVH